MSVSSIYAPSPNFPVMASGGEALHKMCRSHGQNHSSKDFLFTPTGQGQFDKSKHRYDSWPQNDMKLCNVLSFIESELVSKCMQGRAQTVDFDGVGTWSEALTIAKTSWCTPDYNWHRGIEYIRSHPQFLNLMKVSMIVDNDITVKSRHNNHQLLQLNNRAKPVGASSTTL